MVNLDLNETPSSQNNYKNDHTINDHRIKKTVAFVGLMGSGKTTVGRELASKLDCEFIDNDLAIEKHHSMSISEMFSVYGEPYFRRQESVMIQEILCSHNPFVFSLGGGAVLDESNRKLIHDNCLVVWLKASMSVMVERVSGNPFQRPVLSGPTSIEDRLSALSMQRYPLYEQVSHLSFLNDGNDVSKIVNKIYEVLTYKED